MVRRRLASIIAIAVALGALVYGGVAIYAMNEFTLAQRHPPDPEALVAVGGASEDVSFTSADGVVLRAWLFPRGDRAVVMVHGRNGRRLDYEGSLGVATALTSAGYTVLALDLRGHGDSGGDRFSLGQYERLDVAAAIAFLGTRGYAPHRVALYGESMGAGSAIQTLAIRSDLAAIVADSSYTTGAKVVEESFTRESGLPSFFVPGVLAAGRLFGVDVTQIQPVALVAAHPEIPFLFIACENDELVPVHHSRELAAASGNPATALWIVPGCGHVEAHRSAPAEYEGRVLAFLAQQFR